MARALVTALVLTLLAEAAPARTRSEMVASGLTAPVAFVQDPSDPTVQVIVEQGGRVRVLKGGVLQAQDFLDLSGVVVNAGEMGLLGLAFAPDYATSRRFYVYFVVLVDGDPGQPASVVARFLRSEADPLRADPASRFDFLWPGGQRYIPQPYSNHKGGNLAFGPDGYLYLGLGDGGSGGDPENRAQDPASLLGKMLRLDVGVADADPEGYDVPATNPFVGQPGVLPEIWALGLRNPWRWSFDDPALGGTGALVIADVGQGLWEEVDYQPPGVGGRNYGWRRREGRHDYDLSEPAFSLPLTDPIYEYAHTVGRAITGGFVYRGAALDPSFKGRYFFADEVTNRVWSLGLSVAPGTGEATATDLLEHTAQLGAAASAVSSFGVDADGELYLVNYWAGTVSRIAGAITWTTPSTCSLFAIGPTSVHPTFAAGSIEVTVTGSPDGCAGGTWTASGNGSWLTVSPAGGTGSNVVTVSWLENASTAPRSDAATIAGLAFTVTQGGKGRLVPDDFNGDGRTDLTVFRQATGAWYVRQTGARDAASTQYIWGTSIDRPVPGDYDGDGTTDVAVWRPATGTWYILTSSSGFTAWTTHTWGVAPDVPVPGDYDGDRVTDLAVWRPGTGTWYVLTSSTGFTTSAAYGWGAGADQPVPDDYDGDGTTDVAVWRAATGTWYILESSTGFAGSVSAVWGAAGDRPIPGDYDGDGSADLAVFRPATGTWYVLTSSSGFSTSRSYVWGAATDWPVPGDYDGDGSADLAVFRPATGAWYVLQSTTGFTASLTDVWGTVQDTPPGAVKPAAERTMQGDFDGDRLSDVAVWRPSTGAWYVPTLEAESAQPDLYVWGADGDTPVPGDYDGDGRADLVVWREATGTWYVRFSGTGFGTAAAYVWGGAGDRPVPGDYDGDGMTDIAVWRPSTGVWYVLKSSAGFTTWMALAWGAPGDTPAAADFDGDGATDVAIWRPSTGVWYVRPSSLGFAGGGAIVWGGRVAWGASADIPAPADYDGDGRADPAVYRPQTGTWYVLESSTGFTFSGGLVWGADGDVPVPADYDGDGKVDLAVWRQATGAWYILHSITGRTTSRAVVWGGDGDVPVLGRR